MDSHCDLDIRKYLFFCQSFLTNFWRSAVNSNLTAYYFLSSKAFIVPLVGKKTNTTCIARIEFQRYFKYQHSLFGHVAPVDIQQLLTHQYASNSFIGLGTYYFFAGT